jgi:LPXTG-motif cell wall-anchored protein
MISKKNTPYLLGGAALLLLFFLFRRKKSEVMEEQALTAESGETTYPDSQFYAWANRLEQAMFDVGTDEDAIIDVFTAIRNNADFVKLKQAFGVRNYTGGFVPGFLSDDLSLDGWISQELDSSEINQLNSILAAKGITYRF